MDDRFKRHNEGRVKHTQSKRPWKLVYSEERPDRSRAMIREYEIKRHKWKEYVENLIRQFGSG